MFLKMLFTPPIVRILASLPMFKHTYFMAFRELEAISSATCKTKQQ
jgi:hypothetical protein